MGITVGGSRQSSSANQTSQNDLPDWLKNAYQGNLAGAQATAAQGFTPYGGTLTAGDNDYLAAARDQAVGATYAGRGSLEHASKIYGEVADQSPYFFDAAQAGDVIDVNPERATAGSVGGADLSQYTNPYQSQVIDQSNAALARQRQIVDDQNAYAASKAGAFGGSRHGVLDAQNAKNFAQMQQENTNSLLNQGYDRATGLAAADIDRAAGLSQFNAAQGNAAQTQNANLDYSARSGDAALRQAASIANADIDQANTAANLQGAAGLAGVAGAQQQQALSGAQALEAAGLNLQGTQQSSLDAAYKEFLRQQQDPFQRQELLNSALFGIGQGGLTSTTGNSNSRSSEVSASASKNFK